MNNSSPPPTNSSTSSTHAGHGAVSGRTISLDETLAEMGTRLSAHNPNKALDATFESRLQSALDGAHMDRNQGPNAASWKNATDEQILMAPPLNESHTSAADARNVGGSYDRVSGKPEPLEAQATEQLSTAASGALEDRMSTAERRKNMQDLAQLAQTGAPLSVRSPASTAPQSERMPVSSVGPRSDEPAMSQRAALGSSGPLSSRFPASGPLSGRFASAAPSSVGGVRDGEDSGVIDLNAAFGAPSESAANSFPPSALSGAPMSVAPVSGRTSAPVLPHTNSPQTASGHPGVAGSGPHAVTPSSTFTVASGPAASLPPPASLAAAADAPLSSPSGALALNPLAVGHAAAAQPMLAAHRGSQKRGGAILLIGGLATACALAAGTLVYLKSAKTEVPVAQTTIATPANSGAQPPTGLQNTPAVAAKTESVTEAVTPLKETNAKPAIVANTAVAAPGALSGKPLVDSKTAKNDGVATKAVDVAPAAGGANGNLGDAMRQAAGPTESQGAAKTDGPQFAAGSVPQKPSQGALTSAISSSMGAAKACLAEDAPVSRATITFNSSGSVQSVNATGAQAECIKAAFAHAHVAPFAEPTFTTSVTVRH